MDPAVLLPLLSSALSFVFALFLLDQWLERRRPYQLVWMRGMVWYGISAGTQFLGSTIGWSEPLYRAWYLFGAIYVAAWLGLGTMLLLGKTRFGYAAAFSVLLAGVFTVLSQARQYPGQERAFFEFVQKNPQMQQQLRAPIFEDKVVDHIVAQAKVTDKEISKEKLQKAVEALDEM